MRGSAPAEAKPRLARQSGPPWSLDSLSLENTRNPCRLQAGPGPAILKTSELYLLQCCPIPSQREPFSLSSPSIPEIPLVLCELTQCGS